MVITALLQQCGGMIRQVLPVHTRSHIVGLQHPVLEDKGEERSVVLRVPGSSHDTGNEGRRAVLMGVDSLRKGEREKR